MKKGFFYLVVGSYMFASAGCYSPPAVTKDVGKHQVLNCEKMAAPLEAISLTSLAELYPGDLADVPFSADMVGNITAPVQIIEKSTGTAAGRTMRQRFSYALNINIKMKTNIVMYRPLHIDPGLRGC